MKNNLIMNKLIEDGYAILENCINPKVINQIKENINKN